MSHLFPQGMDFRNVFLLATWFKCVCFTFTAKDPWGKYDIVVLTMRLVRFRKSKKIPAKHRCYKFRKKKVGTKGQRAVL